MKKNVIFILIDAVYKQHCFGTPYKPVTLPFINSLAQKGLTANNLYSQAPYTEAALTPLLSGEPLLNKGSYMHRLKYRTSMTEVFKSQGYDTFINHYYPSIYPSAMFKGITDLYYVTPFDFLHVWWYRLEYYRSFFLNQELSNDELYMLYDIIDDNFNAWITQYDLLLKHDEKVRFMQQFMDYPDELLVSSRDTVQREYDTFKNNPYDYLQNLYTQNTDHILFKIETLRLNNKLTDEHRQIIHDRYIKTFDRIFKLNRKLNLKNTHFPFKRFFRACLDRNTHNMYQYIAMYQNSFIDKDLYERINDRFDEAEPQVSAHCFLEHGFDWLKNRTSEKPFFMYLHLDDAHWKETFFTSEKFDLDLLDSEFDAINNYLDKLPNSYHGAITMDLSHIYVDNCIKNFYNKLKENGFLENTIIAITADHGFSFSFDPIRTNYVNNLHKENYNVPFILFDEKHIGVVKNNFFSSYDIAPTIIDAAGLTPASSMTGISMLKNEGRDYAISEYMGGGCPDMLRRPLQLTVRTSNYSVAVGVTLKDGFKNLQLLHVYDLINDPMEYNNLANKISLNKVDKELNILHQRFDEIYLDFYTNKNAFHNC